ncbi:hypothetical protein SAMN05444149_10771 [Pseudosulfitobacter pseudonitzschiae]|uniref:Uncharacterized protein n=1 Tax=Pseudosulfitobacter pseudonitzschiae TaxID=1402135 RepID=A0A073IX15_9RHOB|nr:hypothetical protein [Pseudosulfitobacter pseudonitzschiae]KEJ94893.1 hypothetical protein SUH3_24245 [Pseudosulfitobacter pseudonitzschiae]QKS07371.1 hypothetical protein HT745_02185 [Pseudosulfitobacter pseudonitzschiae]SHF96156.1 hypothetical protein SAMN05444149_10771 [Pseudosulfitobacter pseudonitzschiae]
MKNLPHWCTGPAEILKHGFSLLSEDTDSNRRLAMICIDNAVELTAKTFLSLPKRITAVEISRKQRDAYSATFPDLLDGLETHAAAKVIGLNLGEVEWFHRLRNQLYHQGDGLTVERAKVEAYAEIAEQLFNSLFEVSFSFSNTRATTKLGEFFALWIRIEKAIVGRNMLRQGNLDGYAREMLAEPSNSHSENWMKYRFLRELRNKVAHGEVAAEEAISDEVIADAEVIADILEAQRK